jgi:hypothetical protein
VRRFAVLVVLVAVALGVAAPAAERPPVLVAKGVKIGRVPVGGLSSERARARVQRSFAKPLHFVFGSKSWRATPARLGATAEVDEAVTKALKAAPFQRVPLGVELHGAAAVRRYAKTLDRRFSYPARDARLVGLAGLKPEIRPAEDGLRVKKDLMARTIARALQVGWRGPFALQTESVRPEVTEATFGRVIVIRRGSNELDLFQGSRLTTKFSIATGQSRYPTPTGWFSIVDKQRDPWWRPPDSDWAKGLKPIPPGPGNPLGTRWMGLSAPGVGIHGTPDAASIGYSASHGCIRMLVPNAEWLFNHVDLGTPVFIVSA